MARRLATLLVLVLSLGVSSAHPQEPEASTPTLYSLAVAIVGDPAQAWPAVHQLRELHLSSAKERTAAKKLAESWGEQLPELAGPAAIVRAHAIGALGENAEGAAGALAVGCRRGSDASVRLACALALAEIGEAGVKAAAKELRPDDVVGSTLLCAAFARPGARSPTATKALEKLAKPPVSFREHLLAEPALVALEILGEDTAKLVQARESKLGALEYPVVDGLNWGGIVEAAPHALLLVCGEEGLTTEQDIEAYAKPPALRKHGIGPRLGDHLADYFGHVTRVTGELLPPLASGSIATLDDYATRTRSWTLTIELLMRIEERYVAKPGK